MNIKKRAFTLVEILLTVGIGAVVMTAAMGTVNNVVVLQKKILVAQDFYRETQLLLEQINVYIRNNTLDYDRYFMRTVYSSHDPVGGVNCQLTGDAADADPDTHYTEVKSYPEQFFFENASGDGEIRNYGGLKPSGGILNTEDPCASAWRTGVTHNDLYFIEKMPTSNNFFYQYNIRRDVDSDGIGRVALYRSVVSFNVGLNKVAFNSSDSLVGYLSPKTVNVTSLRFDPSPSADPNFAFALDNKQIHPHVRVSITTELMNPEKYDFTSSLKPNITLSTMATSRLYEQVHVVSPSDNY